MGHAPVLSEMTDGLGQRWELLHNAYKAVSLRDRAACGDRRVPVLGRSMR